MEPTASLRPAPRRRAGFTLAEVLIASAAGSIIVAAVLSLYLFLSNAGRALRSQVEFNNQARVLQAAFVDLVEANFCLLVDADNRGVRLYSDESALEAAASGDEEDTAEWIGYEPGPTVRESRIVYRRNGKGNDPARTLCEWVGPADSGIPMFRLVTGVSVALCAHVGDPAIGSSERDTTGPGRQGMDVVVIGACRNLKRKL
jgi:prepilin-type N-terminal cleavage/methylation domain-containing protein